MEEPIPEQLLLNEIQVLLAEKRTYYALGRTGMTVVTVPLSVLVFLLATSKFHGVFDNWWLAVLVSGGLITLSLYGVIMLSQAQRKLRWINKHIWQIARQNERILRIIV